ncbi:MAG TPA: AAA family ATPase [Candidatus Limnocylindrales bacterium]
MHSVSIQGWEAKALSNSILVLTADGLADNAIVEPLQRAGMNVSVTDDLGSALQHLGEQQLLILDASDESKLAMLCRRINDETGSRHAPILAVAHSHDVEERVHLLEAGADDVIGLPVDERELSALVEALLLRAPAPPTTGEGTTISVPPRSLPTGPGRVIAFAAAKGGSGTTTLAVDTALILAEMAPGSVAIADMDMYHGQVATHLDLYARNSTAQMAREDRSTQTPDMIHDEGKQHASGLMVFGAPYRPDEAIDVSGAQLAALVEQLRGVYGTVIIDAGSTLDMRSLSVLAEADHVVMPITPDIPSLRLLHAALQVMSEAGSLTDKTMFVLNQMYPHPTIMADQIEEHLGVRIALEVPYDGENFLRGVNEGQPLVLLARRSAAAGAIKRLAELTAETRLEHEVMQPARRGRLRSFLGRS